MITNRLRKCSICGKSFIARNPKEMHGCIFSKPPSGTGHSPAIHFSQGFNPETDPLNDCALFDPGIKDNEYNEMLNDHLEKHPENALVDEHDVFDYERSKRINAGGDIAFDYEKYRK